MNLSVREKIGKNGFPIPYKLKGLSASKRKEEKKKKKSAHREKKRDIGRDRERQAKEEQATQHWVGILSVPLFSKASI